MRQRQQSFGKLYQLSIFSILALLFLTMGAVWIYHEYSSHLGGLQNFREDYIASRKQEVQQQVNIHLENIRFKISRMESHLRRNLQSHTDNGWAIADTIYNNNKGSLSDAQIKKLIIEALMPIRFLNGRGYYWIVDTDYTLVAHPFRPDFIGKSEAETVDRQGQKFIRNFIQVAQATPEGGFVSYYWNKPDVDSRLHIEKGEKKIAFLKLFKPYNWVIGTGEYVMDAEAELQQEFLTRLNTLRFGEKGYIFTHTFDGICLSHVNPHNIGQNRWELQDLNDKKVVQEIIRTGRQPEGGFVEYVASIDPQTGQPARKISYVNSLDEWQWVLGAGIYLDDIDRIMAGFQEDLEIELRHRTLFTIALILAALALSYLVSHLLGKRLSRELNIFSTFFKRAATHPETIDTEQLSITEFAHLARAANQMIQERQQTQSDLQQAKEVWEKSFNALSDLVTIHDMDSRIIRANAAVANFFNLPEGEIIGKRCHEIFQHDEGRCPNCPSQKTISDHHSHTSIISFSQLRKTLQISTAITLDDHGEPEFIVHIAKDISEQKRLEDDLIQSRKMEAIGTLAGGIAHDFNNILTSLLGYADLAEEEARDHGNPHPYIQQVITAGNRASDLVKQILAFSRKSEHIQTHISPRRIVEESLKLLRASIPTTVKINKDIRTSEATILADPTKIHQIVVNLCTNGVHAMNDQQGTLTVRLTRRELSAEDLRDHLELSPGSFMELAISDTGHGMGPQVIAHIFDPYFTTKDVGKGVGMGLAVVHGIVKEHGGFITVESEIGHGSTFRVFLPISHQPPRPQAPPEVASFPTGNERILVIDDEEAITAMLKGGLERFGYQVTALTSSTKALAELTAAPDSVDLVITDQTMPDLPGMALAEKVLQLRPSLPIILYTGYSDLVSEKTARQIGISEFLLKPVDSKTMAAVVRKLLDASPAMAGSASQREEVQK